MAAENRPVLVIDGKAVSTFEAFIDLVLSFVQSLGLYPTDWGWDGNPNTLLEMIDGLFVEEGGWSVERVAGVDEIEPLDAVHAALQDPHRRYHDPARSDPDWTLYEEYVGAFRAGAQLGGELQLTG